MNESVIKARIVDKIALLEAHVSVSIEHNLLDVTNALEVLYKEIPNMTQGWDLVSANFPNRNFPAIDLHDPGRRIAVQVTANCTKQKIEKTEDTFNKSGLKECYDRLVVVCPKKTRTPKASGCRTEVWTGTRALNLENLNLCELGELDDRLSRSIEWHKITQTSDKHCFDVVLGVLDRDAIRHSTEIEGDFDDMLAALKQIKQLVTEGEISGTRIQAKNCSLYEDEYVEILDEIALKVGLMMSELKRNYEPQYRMLPRQSADRIDSFRVELVSEVNEFSKRHGHKKVIEIRNSI